MSEKQNNEVFPPQRPPSQEPPPENKRCCYHCHFLCRKGIDKDTKKSYTLDVPLKARKNCYDNKKINTELDGILACYKDVWDGASHMSAQEEYTRKTLAWDREDGCFFYLHTPLMSFSAAEILERREADRREAKKDRKIAKWSIIVGAAIGLIGIVVGLIIALSST